MTKMKMTILKTVGIVAVMCSAVLGAEVKTQIVLLRTYISTNTIPGYIGGAEPSPIVGTNGYLNMVTTAQAVVHPPRTEIVTNYVLGFYNGTNAVELITAEKR